jgi:hypothetical protein
MDAKCSSADYQKKGFQKENPGTPVREEIRELEKTISCGRLAFEAAPFYPDAPNCARYLQRSFFS